MTGHLGYEKHDPAGRGSGNGRNCITGKTVLTEVGRWTWPFNHESAFVTRTEPFWAAYF